MSASNTRAVMGIDPSLTATGVAHASGGTDVISWPGRGIDRLDTAYQWAAGAGQILGDEQLLVVVEGYAHGRANQAHQLGELGGAIRLGLKHAGVEVLDVPPAVVKKYATGKGNANKDLVRDAARDRLGPLAPGISSDECDALWLRQIGLRLTGHVDAVEVPATHRAALDKLDHSVSEATA